MAIIVNLCTRKDSDYKKYWNDKFFFIPFRNNTIKNQ